jgi:LysR family nitrogen assimilation transcriptional regulator
VTVSFPSAACNVLSVPLAEAVRRRLPQILLRVMDAMSGYVQQSLNEGAVDLGILYDVNEARHLRFTPLLIEDLFLVAAAERWPHRGAANGVSCVPVRLTDCAGLGLILPHRTHGLREMIERVTEARGLRLNVILEMDALTNLKRLVVRGAGYTILAPAAVEDEVAQHKLVLVPISDAPMRRTVHLVRNPLRMVTRAAQEVERLAVEVTLELV